MTAADVHTAMRRRPLPTRQGRWGVHQFDVLTGEQSGGTVWMGWPTREQAVAANPDTETWRYEVYDRWPCLSEGEVLPRLSRPKTKPVEVVQTSLFDAA